MTKGIIMTEHSKNSSLIPTTNLCKLGNVIFESTKQLRDIIIAYETMVY
jgi:hypothetical protein